jgi:hypothetical protein
MVRCGTVLWHSAGVTHAIYVDDFDPPTNAHQWALQALVKAFDPA